MRTYTASRWFWPVLLGLSGGLSVGLLIFGSLALGLPFQRPLSCCSRRCTRLTGVNDAELTAFSLLTCRTAPALAL